MKREISSLVTKSCKESSREESFCEIADYIKSFDENDIIEMFNLGDVLNLFMVTQEINPKGQRLLNFLGEIENNKYIRKQLIRDLSYKEGDTLTATKLEVILDLMQFCDRDEQETLTFQLLNIFERAMCSKEEFYILCDKMTNIIFALTKIKSYSLFKTAFDKLSENNSYIFDNIFNTIISVADTDNMLNLCKALEALREKHIDGKKGKEGIERAGECDRIIQPYKEKINTKISEVKEQIQRTSMNTFDTTSQNL